MRGDDRNRPRDVTENRREGDRAVVLPSVELPKGGGAIRGIGEKFAANPVTGAGSMTVPIATSPGRSGFGPALALSYDSSAGNGVFGFGWSLSHPAITRKTDRGLPRYQDDDESDVFLLSASDDLVPMLDGAGMPVVDTTSVAGFTIRRYRPRVEGLFARIERWTRRADGDVHWRTLGADNLLTIYGRDAGSRIVDPDDPRRIFTWLFCETRDDRGNAVVAEYKAEDAVGVDVRLPHEASRGDVMSATRTANRYLKRLRYGNRVPLLDAQGRRPVDLTVAEVGNAGWMFELVLDYGEHDALAPSPDDAGAWICRNDPFSSYRAGFEIRTYRLCQRALMFHHFPAEAGVGQNCLVRSTDIGYRETRGIASDRQRGHPIASFIATVTQRGYVRAAAGGYTAQSMPPVSFEYSNAVIDPTVHEVDLPSLENLPAGLDDPTLTWIDLDGEGLPGVLAEQADGWFYKPNLGEGALGPLTRVATRPSLANLTGGRQQLVDLAGDGLLELVQLGAEPAGFFERTEERGWDDFVPFASRPTIDWLSPSVRLVDLTGDGQADVLVTEEEAITWYPALGEQGFGPAERLWTAPTEDRGPRVVFADGTDTLFLADMSGDGLPDLVRVRNAEIVYWPNAGYGRFGAKVTMDGAPRLDRPGRFDPRRIRLADIDGTGVVDLFYVGADEITLWRNQAGNGWSAGERLPQLPDLGDLTDVTVVDLLGNGTACLVWSSALPGDARRPMYYVDLMGGTKPHLLVGVVNNMGAETRVQYAPSTRFYLADRRAGRPWITRLPFPVHVIERTEQIDHIARTRFASRYRYHHGYFDGEEREFRGFAMVEQDDTEAFEDYVVGVVHLDGTQDLAPELYQPPVTTRTWFHTGAYLGRDRVLHQLRDEYYLGLQSVAEPLLPAGMDEVEFRECIRALKGSPLRTESYSFDGSAQASHPYSVVEHSYDVVLVQPRVGQRHAVLAARGCETVTHYYERNPADPRVTQTLALEIGAYGEVHRSASAVYGRQTVDPLLPAEVTSDQQRMYVTYGETDYTPDIDRLAPVPAYRLRAPCDSRTFEITGVTPAGALFTRAELAAKIAGTAPMAYEATASGVGPKRRPLSQARTRYRDDSLAPLPLGQWDTLAIGYESYQLALTPSVVATYYGGTVADSDLVAAGYVHSEGDSNWWIPSGTALYPPNPATHFYQPTGARDALGLETQMTIDQYDLLVERVRIVSAAWTEVSSANDYRLLGPVLVTDANKNRAAVEADALGRVVKSALMGKAGAGEGDTLADPTTRVEYEVFNWMNSRKPNRAHTFARERHSAANPRWQESYVYSSGSGGVALTKVQAHPGRALSIDALGVASEVDADPRWIGNGRTIVNNKGQPVKEYEPYFSPTHEYEDEKTLREIGSTAVMYYDAVGRNVRTVVPDGTFARTEFEPWRQRTFDPNDTVLASQWYADRGSPDPAISPEPVNDPPRRAAWLAAKHAGTPITAHADSLGRSVYMVSDYGGGMTSAVRSESDLTGRLSRLFDQVGRVVGSSFATMSGAAIQAESAEKGKRWILMNVLGAVVRSWDEFGRRFRVGYDLLHRPTSTYVAEPAQPELLFSYVVYGDRHPDPVPNNLLGVAHQVFDSAGAVRVDALDFKGNAKVVVRTLASDYTAMPDWTTLAAQAGYAAIQTAAAASLDTTESFVATSTADALNRPIEVTLPDSTVMRPTYNEGNILASLQVQVGGNGPFVEYLKEQDYDAKGQRLYARYGNDVVTRYFYDPKSYRLTNLLTFRAGDDPATSSLQDLRYTYDPVGNITQVADAAQQTKFFANAVVNAETRFEYDAVYQLVKARGRELAGSLNDDRRDDRDIDFVPQLPHVNNASAVRNYTEEYNYDLLGNIVRKRHIVAAGTGSWTRHYRYAYQLDATDRTNRLAVTSGPGDPDAGPWTVTYDYDRYGNMTRLRTPTPGELTWDVMDRLAEVDLGGGGRAYYRYSAGGQRTRKIIERIGGQRVERIYLGPLEIYRERQGVGAPRFERHTLHVSDDTGRIAQVDVKTRDDDGVDPANPLGTPLVRYQYGNHLGSAVLETDANGVVISYEEYHPFGTTSYRSSKPGANLSLKRYRFAGKERDDETGLYYHGARYYAPWLGRWTSTDPAGFVDGINLFRYSRNNPVMFVDPSGHGPKKAQPGALNPVGEVTWKSGDVKTVGDFERAYPPDNPSMPYTRGTVTMKMVDRVVKGGTVKTPVFNAEWLDPKTGQPKIPRVAEPGFVASWGSQAKPEYEVEGDPSTIKTIKEHVAPRAQDKRVGDAGLAESKKTPTMVNPKAVADAKTPADNAATAQLKQQQAAGKPINYVEDVTLPSIERQKAANASKGSPVPEGSAERAGLSQLYYKFENKGLSEVAGELPMPTRWQRVTGAARDLGRSLLYSFDGTNRVKAAGTVLARSFIPGFVEAEMAAVYAHPFVVGTLGITTGPLPAVAEAIAAAPTTFAFAVTLPAIGGAIAGNVVESIATSAGASKEVSIGAAVVGAAGVGAVIGTFIPIPGVGTLAGAGIGAAIGVIGYGISKLF